MCAVTNRKRNGQKSRQRSSLLFGGRNSFNSMPHYRFSTRMIWRNRRTDVWYTGWFRKTPTNPTTWQNGCSFKNFSSNQDSLLLHNRQVRHSSTFPKQQGRPLPSLPSVSSSMTAPKDRRRVALSGSPLSCSMRALTTAVVLYRELDHSRTRHRNPASMYKLAGKKGRHIWVVLTKTSQERALDFLRQEKGIAEYRYRTFLDINDKSISDSSCFYPSPTFEA